MEHTGLGTCARMAAVVIGIVIAVVLVLAGIADWIRHPLD